MRFLSRITAFVKYHIKGWNLVSEYKENLVLTQYFLLLSSSSHSERISEVHFANYMNKKIVLCKKYSHSSL